MRAARIVAIAAILALLPLAAAPARAGELDGIQDRRVRKGAEIVLEVRQKMKELHVDGARFGDADYCAAALAALRRGLEAGDLPIRLAAEERDALLVLVRAKAPEDGSFAGVFAELDRRLAGRSQDEVYVVTDALARGVVETVGDPFTHYFDSKTMWSVVTQIFGGKPRSFGFKAVNEGGAWRVGFIFHGYEASEKGLAQGDIIVEVNGIPAAALTEKEMIAMTSGRRETELRLRVYRKGWKRAHEVTLAATAPEAANVEYEMLPGGIGYVRLDTFLAQAGGQVERAVLALEKQGMKALVFDVRNNPGGAVLSCIEICDLFLGEKELITKTASREQNPMGAQTYYAKDEGTRPRYPMAILVNGSSASASEMFAGALKDNGRAVLVGETTYGKGVGQSPVLLNAAFGERFLLLTQMTYFTPRGTTPQRVGIEADVPVPPAALDAADAEAVFELKARGLFARYVEERFEKEKPILFVLAKEDGGDAARYPGFDAWHAALVAGPEGKPSRDACRRELRAAVRRTIVAKDKRITLAADARDDIQLRRAREVVLERLAAGPTAAVAARARREPALY